MKTKLLVILSLTGFILSVYPTAVSAQYDFTHVGDQAVLGFGADGEWDDGAVWFPEVIKDGDTLRMWYTGLDDEVWEARTWSIGYAWSLDRIEWNKYSGNPVLKAKNPWEGIGIVGCAVIKDGDMFKMWYGGYFLPQGIGYATSPDGKRWTRNSTPVLVVGPFLDWDDDFIWPTTVIKEDNEYKMWYWAGRPGFPFEGSFAQTGFATSTDGIHWIKYDDPATTEAPYANSDPVLKLGVSPFAWDHDRTIIPVVRSTETGYEMWYTGLCLGITGEHIGYATSDDGISWNKYADNPIFADDQVDWGHVLYGGAVLKYDEYYHLWFANFTTTDWARPQIGYARSKTAGIDWHDKNSQYLMSPNYPNPFSHSTIFEYRIDEPAVVALTIYNHLGQQIESLVNNHQQQGKHQAVWNAEGLPAGIYFYRLQAGEQQATGKMVVLR